MSSQTVSYAQLSSKYVPLGILVAIFSVIAIVILQITRRIRRMPAYFMSNFSLCKKNPKLAIIATILYYLLLMVPVALLIAWIAVIGQGNGANPALPILFTFLFVVSLIIPVPSDFFYLKVLIAFIFFITSQIITMALFWDNQSSSGFFTLSSILLSINGCFVSISLWLFDGTSWALPQYTSQANKDKIRETVQIWKDADVPPKIIDGGLYYYITIRPTLKIVLTIVFYLLSLITLLVYSLVGYYKTVFGTIALINSICVITTDIILTMVIFITKESKTNPIVNSIAAMALRACLVGFAGDTWFLGYCFLYLILGIYMTVLIINKYYPNFQKLPSLTIEKRNIFMMPEMPTLILNIMFAGAIFYVADGNGGNLKSVGFVMNSTYYDFWVIGIAFMILQFAIFFYLISLRIVERSRSRIRSINFYYMGCQSCSQYYFFIFFAYALLVILGFYMYSHSKSSFIWNSCVFLPLFYQALILFYANWIENDYLLLGSVQVYNKKMEKRKERVQKIKSLKSNIMKKMKIQDMSEANEEQKMKHQQKGQNGNGAETSTLQMLDGAEVQSNFMVQDAKGNTIAEWRNTYGLLAAFREDKLLPTDKKVIISLIVMFVSLVGYCIVYTITQNDATAIIISVEIIFLFLTLTPMKRYFSTLQTPHLGLIISFALGIVLNYAFGACSYAFNWNRTNLWTIWWAVINMFVLSVYAALAFLRDKGLDLITYIVCAVSVLLLTASGIIILVLFNSIALGVALIGASIYYGYVIALYIIYLVQNKSFPQFIHIITLAIVVCTCFAVMIFGFISDSLDDFYGFSITYLVINFLIVVYGAHSLFLDYYNRFDHPNFYSPYGTPIFKYDSSVLSVKSNPSPLMMWLGGWFMYYGYTILMEIFLVNVNQGISASSIFLVVVFLSFIYFSTYNVYNAGKLKDSITQKVIQESWKQIIDVKIKNGGTDININTLKKQLDGYIAQAQAGVKVQIKPTGLQSKTADGKSAPNIKNGELKGSNANLSSDQDINLIIDDLSQKLEKAIQNQQILLVNLWTRVMLKCEALKKNKMMKFINFVKEDGQRLAEIGIAIVIDMEIYDIQFIYNQAIQQYNMLAPVQKFQFDKKFKQYLERKSKNDQQNEEYHNKQRQAQIKRQEQLKKKLLQQKNISSGDQNNKPVEQMLDSPLKMQKLCQQLQAPYVDNSFQASHKNLPDSAKSQCKQWSRPSADCQIVKQSTAMSVRQGYIGDCYLISAIGVLDVKSIKKILGIGEWKNAPGSFMVRFKKDGKDVYTIIDNRFPSVGGDEWLLGRCENKKEIFTNILEKAYAKLYGGYQNIVGGKVSLALADMTGGFPEEIKLKKYQQQNMNELFNLMVQFKAAGYLMGAGSPQNTKGDTVDVDGIVQGHAYLVLDIKDLDGNKIIKLRNPHGVGGRQSTLDWSDKSPKWTKRLLNLLGQSMADDGAFWMGIQDFVFCYRSLYICRIFDQNIWKKHGPISGAWKGESAAGLPTKKFPTAKMSKNPHYGIKVSKKSTLFLQLQQNQLDDKRSGKNYIFFMVQKNGGMRISSNSSDKLCGSSGPPINSTSVSGQIDLSADSYPYTFSLMVSAYQQGCQGTYQLNFYCNDTKFEVIDESVFDK